LFLCLSVRLYACLPICLSGCLVDNSLFLQSVLTTAVGLHERGLRIQARTRLELRRRIP